LYLKNRRKGTAVSDHETRTSTMRFDQNLQHEEGRQPWSQVINHTCIRQRLQMEESPWSRYSSGFSGMAPAGSCCIPQASRQAQHKHEASQGSHEFPKQLGMLVIQKHPMQLVVVLPQPVGKAALDLVS
jgi:hypothetical protein